MNEENIELLAGAARTVTADTNDCDVTGSVVDIDDYRNFEKTGYPDDAPNI